VQALLFALLGAVLGGGTVLAFRFSERQMRPDDLLPQPDLPPGVAAVLSVLRRSALVVDACDTVL
jgi:two-component system sensor histidine kinase SenX3